MEGPKPVEEKGHGRHMLESMFGVEREPLHVVEPMHADCPSDRPRHAASRHRFGGRRPRVVPDRAPSVRLFLGIVRLVFVLLPAAVVCPAAVFNLKVVTDASPDYSDLPSMIRSIAFETVTMLNSKTQPRLNLGRNSVYVGAGAQTESIVFWPDLQGTNAQAYLVGWRRTTNRRLLPLPSDGRGQG